MAEAGAPGPPIFYGRRRGKKLRRGRRHLIEELLPRLCIAEPAPGMDLDPRRLFEPAPPHQSAHRAKSVWLEVGFGGGEHLAAQAFEHPEIGLIGCEPFINGVASLLRHIDERALSNIRIFPGDVRRLLPALPDASLEKVFVLFPDPWPKTRHAGRRFISTDNLDTLARLLVGGGELRVASDEAGYIEWALEHLAAHPLFEIVAKSYERPSDWPPTRYEAKAQSEGRAPVFIRVRRRPRPVR